MAAIGGFPGQNHSAELAAHQATQRLGAKIDQMLKPTLMVAASGPYLLCCNVPVGDDLHAEKCTKWGWAAETSADDLFACCSTTLADPHAEDCPGWDVKPDGSGWAWGDTTGGEWLTIPGSHHKRPELGRSPGTAYLMGPQQPDMNTVCALVVPTHHSGVASGRAFRIVQQARPLPLNLTNALAYEGQEEDAGVLEADDRTTCHTCQDWATDQHTESPGHWAKLRMESSLVLAQNRADLAGFMAAMQ